MSSGSASLFTRRDCNHGSPIINALTASDTIPEVWQLLVLLTPLVFTMKVVSAVASIVDTIISLVRL